MAEHKVASASAHFPLAQPSQSIAFPSHVCYRPRDISDDAPGRRQVSGAQKESLRVVPRNRFGNFSNLSPDALFLP